MGYIFINNEKCFQISGFEKYHISESGRIYRTSSSAKGFLNTHKKVYLNEKKIHFKIRNGNLNQGFASLTDNNGKLCNVAVAPLVAKAFDLISGKLKKKQAINYKDGNKKNLHFSNLIVSEKRNSNYKLSLADVKRIKKQIKNGVPLNRIGERFGVSEMQINRIKTGENWGNGKRKIKAPEAPFEIKNGRMRKYIATFESKKTTDSIRKKFTVRRNPEKPTDNTIVGIVNGYKLSLKHKNITRAKQITKKLNDYFFENQMI